MNNLTKMEKNKAEMNLRLQQDNSIYHSCMLQLAELFVKKPFDVNLEKVCELVINECALSHRKFEDADLAYRYLEYLILSLNYELNLEELQQWVPISELKKENRIHPNFFNEFNWTYEAYNRVRWGLHWHFKEFWSHNYDIMRRKNLNWVDKFVAKEEWDVDFFLFKVDSMLNLLVSHHISDKHVRNLLRWGFVKANEIQKMEYVGPISLKTSTFWKFPEEHKDSFLEVCRARMHLALYEKRIIVHISGQTHMCVVNNFDYVWRNQVLVQNAHIYKKLRKFKVNDLVMSPEELVDYNIQISLEHSMDTLRISDDVTRMTSEDDINFSSETMDAIQDFLKEDTENKKKESKMQKKNTSSEEDDETEWIMEEEEKRRKTDYFVKEDDFY